MSMYQMMHGVNPATFWFLPMMGKHPDDYPRFRDCFLVPHQFKLSDEGLPWMSAVDDNSEPDGHLYILTRTGGGNRPDYQTYIDDMRAIPEYVEDRDDPFDSTYAHFKFRVPDKWRGDFDNLMMGNSASEEYIVECCRVFPKVADKIREALSQ